VHNPHLRGIVEDTRRLRGAERILLGPQVPDDRDLEVSAQRR